MAKPRDNRHKDLLRPALEAVIDLGHPLARLAREIDWGFLDRPVVSMYRRALTTARKSVVRVGPIFSAAAASPLPAAVLRQLHRLHSADLPGRAADEWFQSTSCPSRLITRRIHKLLKATGRLSPPRIELDQRANLLASICLGFTAFHQPEAPRKFLQMVPRSVPVGGI
jgi:hypothetical protein